jgi:hypothetical protein
MVVVFASASVSCGKKADHWGKNFDESGSWWNQEGQSWNRDNNVFMTIGYSNPDWKDKYDARKSADLNARAQVAEFMASLVKTYADEVRSRNFTISESEIKSAADETVIGSVIVDRKFKKKQYMSLIKVDLGYFFASVYKKYRAGEEAKISRSNPKANGAELDALIRSKVDAAAAELQQAEAPSVEKAMAATEAGPSSEKN